METLIFSSKEQVKRIAFATKAEIILVIVFRDAV